MAVEQVMDAGNIVGESIVWDDRNDRLLWVDIVPGTIHALTPAAGGTERWQAPGRVTSIGLRRDGGAVVGLEREVCLWEPGGAFRPLARVEPDRPGNRLNEGVVGPDGAFWVGTMQNNIAPDGSPVEIDRDSGRLYRCTADGAVYPLCDDDFGITNTFVWTDDGGLVTADTLRNEIYRYSIDGAGRLTDRRTLLAGHPRGLPDGSARDAEGYVWNCRVAGGACVIRLDPDGRIDRVIDLPCSWPTSCAFGGPDLATLYVTSARFTMSPGHLDRNPQEGAVFAVTPGVRGLPAHRFG